MSRCKSCGKEIKWIKMATGRSMPVDIEAISYKIDMSKGNMVLITPDGRVTRGFFDPGSDSIGYTSHFATCPNANAHRKDRR